MTRYSTEWIVSVLEDLEQFCLEHSMPQSEEAIARAIRKAKSESCSEMLDAAIALNTAKTVMSS